MLAGNLFNVEPHIVNAVSHVLYIAAHTAVGVAAFVFIGIAAPSLRYLWLSFLYAVPASAIVVLVFSCVWQNKTVRIISMSVMIWSILACIFTTAYVCGLRQNMWLIFLLGIPLQILALVFFVWWKRIRLFKHKD